MSFLVRPIRPFAGSAKLTQQVVRQTHQVCRGHGQGVVTRHYYPSAVGLSRRFSSMTANNNTTTTTNNNNNNNTNNNSDHSNNDSTNTNNNSANESETHFGFRQVPENSKEELVGEVFHKCAEKYDIMNDFMSGTLHRVWKDEFVRMAEPLAVPGYAMKSLDMAGGTGDIAFRLLEASKRSLGNNGPITRTNKDTTTTEAPFCVTVSDINPSMLGVGKERAVKRGHVDSAEIRWQEANAEVLPFEDNSFDLYTIAFGIRNCTHVDRVVAEAHRVLKPGGRFMVLEFSHMAHPLLQQGYDAYSFNIIPLLGEIVAQDRASYQYLVESIRRFPKQLEFEAIIRDQGFKYVQHRNLSLGVVAIHSGIKLP